MTPLVSWVASHPVLARAALVAGGVLALASLPGASLWWTVIPLLMAGAGMGLALPALAGELLPERTPGEAARLLALRHAGITVALALLAPVAATGLGACSTGPERTTKTPDPLIALVDAARADAALAAAAIAANPDLTARVEPLRRAFGVPDAITPVGAVTVGHPDPAARTGGSARTRARRPQDDVVHRGRWG